MYLYEIAMAVARRRLKHYLVLSVCVSVHPVVVKVVVLIPSKGGEASNLVMSQNGKMAYIELLYKMEG